jgi:hypothetical protein
MMTGTFRAVLAQGEQHQRKRLLQPDAEIAVIDRLDRVHL